VRLIFLAPRAEKLNFLNAIREGPSVGTVNKILGIERDGSRFEVIYFVVEEPRLGTDEFNRVVNKALENNLKVFPASVTASSVFSIIKSKVTSSETGDGIGKVKAYTEGF